MAVTYEDIKKAVFYSQQKPELLADIIADVADVPKPGDDTASDDTGSTDTGN